MIRLKFTVKRTIVFLLILVIAATILVKSDMVSLKADASVSSVETLHPLTFYVPETIYLTPSASTTSAFQYYVDCNSSGVLTKSNVDTAGNIYFYCAGATSASISWEGASVTLGASSGTTTIDTTITAGSLSSPITAGTTSYITWTVSYTVNGDSRTAKAYSVCYAPIVSEVAAGVRQVHTYGDDVFNQGVLWLIGFHTFSGGGYNCGKNFFTDAAPAPDSHTGIADDGWFSSYSNGGSGFNDDEHTSNASDDESATGGTGAITVDSSRYTNLNQIPNLKLGFWQCDSEGDGDGVNGWVRQTVDSVTTEPCTMANSAEGLRLSAAVSYANSLAFTYTKHIYFSAFTATSIGQRYNNNNYYIDLSVTYIDKTSLRSQVKTCIQAGLQQADYPLATWSTYISALSAAATALGNPIASDTVITAAATALLNAYTALDKTTYTATINHKLPCSVGVTGLVNGTTYTDSDEDGYLIITETNNFSSGDTVYFAPNSYTGYTISSAAGTTTSTSSQTCNNRRELISETYYYTANPCIVTLNYGTDPVGGKGHQLFTSSYNVSAITVKYNYTYNDFTLPNPTMTGWCFSGWYNSSNYSTKVLGTAVMNQTADHTLYARWAPYFSGGHGKKTGDIVNGTTLTFDDMFLISNTSDFYKINMFDSTYYYTSTSDISYKQTADLSLDE